MPEPKSNVEPAESRILSDDETVEISGGNGSDDPGNPVDGPTDPIPPPPPPSQPGG